MENVLKINNLKYKDILNDITFSLKDKSFNILIGANGSGKTILVNSIRGLLKYNGEILIFNNNINQKNNFNIYREVGFFLNDNLYLEDCIFNELLELLKNLDYEEEKARKKIFDIAKEFDIINILYKQKDGLSSCEKTLLSFIFSIIHDPKLLIIDNELNNLNFNYKKIVLDYIKNKNNLTVLFITTNSDFFHYADNIFGLKDGKIMFECTYKDIVNYEKAIIKCGAKLPFYIDLSNKLMSYELLDKVETDVEKMVNEIWK